MADTSFSESYLTIPEELFIKDYKETKRILDEATRNTLKKMNELDAAQ